ncbi:MAG: DMT family transporter [Desulfobacteraceae bacterium]|nr:DMT family transporter [Desulfobacteraceae bacterium]
MLSIGLSIAACMGWGIADFIGGYKSRHLPTLTVLVFSTISGFFCLGVLLLFQGNPFPGDPMIFWAIPAGGIGIVAMFLLYKSLAVGSMSVLAPISATGVILPVMWGVMQGDDLSQVKMAGICAAILGSILAAMEKGPDNTKKKWAQGIELALGAAVCIGLYFIVMDNACQKDPLWATTIMRTTTIIFLIPMVFFARAPVKIHPGHLPLIICMGLVDTLAAFSFALATSYGMLSIVSVISSLYPAVTVLLSTLIVGERIRKVQSSGVVLAMIGVVLISGF